jgi:hypothetical protein
MVKFIKKHDEHGMAFQVVSHDDAAGGNDHPFEGIPFQTKHGNRKSTGRKFYAWEKSGDFFLSAFREPRAHDGKRPAIEFLTKEALETEAQRLGLNVVWEA